MNADEHRSKTMILSLRYPCSSVFICGHTFLKSLILESLFGGFASAASVPAAPTFNRDVLPVLERRCQTCHRPATLSSAAALN